MTDPDPDPGLGSPVPGRVLVTGATGGIGAHLVDTLQARGAPFAVMCRRAEQRDVFRARGIEAVEGDFSDSTSIRDAMPGFEQLFLLAPESLDQYGQDIAAIDAAVAAGVRHVVKISTLDANPTSAIPWARDHARADAYLAATGLRWTRLAPGAFTKNLLELAPAIQHGLLPGTSGHGATSWVDVRDIAEVAARVLTEPDLQGDQAGRSYTLTGTHPLSFPEIATILGDELGRRVRYVHLPGPAMYASLRLSGLPHWQARGLVRQFVDVVRRGADQGRVHTFELDELLGGKPRGIADLVHSHRADFTRHR
ncbi:MAG: NAD(P)H-binding protein [Actinomycetota bacterium]|nr:NAD(P)H-binding protein [Actinomycetota bacterium]